MSTKPTHASKATDHPSLSTIRAKSAVGIDGEDATHYFDSVRQTVYVVRGSHIEHVESIGDRSLTEWVAYVETARGWETLWFTPGGLSALLSEGSD